MLVLCNSGKSLLNFSLVSFSYISEMATKRRPLHTPTSGSTPPPPRMNFRGGSSSDTRTDAKGTRPTANPTSVKEVLTMMLLYVCKKTIFFDVRLKVALYLGSLFLVSLIGDFIPFPKTYFSRSDNLFNVYFVKLGWFWTLLFSLPFSVISSYILCCGDKNRIIRHHLPRIFIATMFWYVWTKFFNYIESYYGRCSTRSYDTKVACLKAGHFWQGFDISGHAFILIYSSLILIEEARPIINWESIKDLLRDEEHNRTMGDSSTSTLISNPLKNLKDDQIERLRYLYNRYTPVVRILFVGMAALQLLWDVMLVCTMLYYHNMIEKVLSGIIAILTWFFTYQAWYPNHGVLPDKPGKGLFIYQKEKPATQSQIPPRRTQNVGNVGAANPNQVPKFMGMPLYSNLNQQFNPGAASTSSGPSNTYYGRRGSQELGGFAEARF